MHVDADQHVRSCRVPTIGCDVVPPCRPTTREVRSPSGTARPELTAGWCGTRWPWLPRQPPPRRAVLADEARDRPARRSRDLGSYSASQRVRRARAPDLTLPADRIAPRSDGLEAALASDPNWAARGSTSTRFDLSAVGYRTERREDPRPPFGHRAPGGCGARRWSWREIAAAVRRRPTTMSDLSRAAPSALVGDIYRELVSHMSGFPPDPLIAPRSLVFSVASDAQGAARVPALASCVPRARRPRPGGSRRSSQTRSACPPPRSA